MKLSSLTDTIRLRRQHGPSDVALTDLTDDSRHLHPGSLFILRGPITHARRNYLADAVARRPAAIITPPLDPRYAPPRSVAWLTADTVDQALAGQLAERFFDYPSRKLKLVGITGTNGKTTTAFILRHLLRQAGLHVGLIGTIEIDDGAGHIHPAGLTTPGAIQFSRLLARMVAHGCQAAVAEVSSHALAQGRTAALDFDAAIFTNLTGDHLDYHGSMQAYVSAKAALFDQLAPHAWAIVNADDVHTAQMTRNTHAHRLWTTLRRDWADALDPGQVNDPVCEGRILELSAGESRVRFDGQWGSLNLRLPLVGKHNVANALQAAAAADVLVPTMTSQLRPALESCPSAPGRLEAIPNDRFPLRARTAGRKDLATSSSSSDLPAVFVDYAHTHDALENVLLALRPLTRGRLIVLFGCGGDRDKIKRPKMAAIACRLADIVFITSDNPRTEDPQAIIDDILVGVPPSRRHIVTTIPDRARAIAQCIRQGHSADTVLLAGKGHENYQIRRYERLDFDDRRHAVAALENRLQYANA